MSTVRGAHATDRAVELGLRAYGVLAYLFLYLPILVVVILSFNDSRFVQAWAGVTTHWYADAWKDANIQSGLRNSLLAAALNMVVAVTLGTLLALGLRRASRRLVALFLAVLYMAIVTPEIVMGLSSLLYFVQVGRLLGISNILGIPTIVLSHAVFNSAIVALIVRARLSGVDESLHEASADLGATPWGTFWQVTVPLLLPAIVAGALLAFTFSFDDFIITQFVSGPQSSTLPIRIWGMIRFGVSPIVNAVATVILMFTLTSVFLAQYVLTSEQASPRPLLLWFTFVSGVVFYGLGPGQGYWANLLPIDDLPKFVTFMGIWFAALYLLLRSVIWVRSLGQQLPRSTPARA